jgi:rhodanese-related sulfurtransferase
MQPPVPTVAVDQVPAGALLLDVREDEEWIAGHIDGAVHIPMYELPDWLASDPPEPDRALYVICKVGSRSALVATWLNQQGYQAFNVEGGMMAWANSRRPMISTTGETPQVV